MRLMNTVSPPVFSPLLLRLFPVLFLHLMVPLLALGGIGITAAPAAAGTLLVANKSDATLSLLSFPGGRRVGLVPTGEGPQEIAVSLDGDRALVTNYGSSERPGNTLTLVDVASAQAVATITLPEGAKPHGIEWLDDRRAVVTAEGLGALLIVDVDEGKVLQRINTEQDVSHMVVVTPDRRLAFVSNTGSGSVSVIDLPNAKLLEILPTGQGAQGIALASNGSQLWITNGAGDTVSIIGMADRSVSANLQTPGFPVRAEHDTRRGRMYIALPAADAMAAFATASRERTHYVEFDLPAQGDPQTAATESKVDSSFPMGMQIAEEHSLLFVAHTAASVISAWDTRALKHVGYYRAGLEPDGMGWSQLDVAVQR
ncbi:MAG: cytochrome D1 domain-containing protein [Pseudomonadota bacterium]